MNKQQLVKALSILSMFFVLSMILFSIIVVDAEETDHLSSDLNSDSLVDVRDYVKLILSYNKVDLKCDINKDGIVNMADLSILISDFGMAIPTSTPTPTLNSLQQSQQSTTTRTLLC